MDAFEFGRNGFFILVGVLGYGGAILFALYIIGLVLHVLAELIANAGRNDDEERPKGK